MKIPIPAGELGAAIRADAKRFPEGLEAGIRAGAQRGRSYLVQKSPVDTGQFKNSWRVGEGISSFLHARKNRKTGALTGTNRTYHVISLFNDAPHAGIIERGARPHGVNIEGMNALIRWARRKLGLDEKAAAGLARGIALKLAHHGQKGKFIVRDNIEHLRWMMIGSVTTALARVRMGGK